MASSDHGSSLFERDKVASSVSADEALPFLADHGFFYQSDGEIGKLVLQLYARKASNQLEGLSLFRQRLQSDPRVARILEHYSVQAPFAAYAWGTTQGLHPDGEFFAATYKADYRNFLYVYMLAPNSRWVLCDRSPRSPDLNKERDFRDIGVYHMPDGFLEGFNKIIVEMKEGGVVLMDPRSSFSSAGKSITYGLPIKS